MITTGYTAEYGRTSGAIINAITKSGTNQFHGTGFFFDRDNIFDAQNFFDGHSDPIPSFRRIQFGASGGGAIIKDKTFLYGTYEGVRQNHPVSQLSTCPPTRNVLRWLAPPSLTISNCGRKLPLAPRLIATATQTFGVALPSITTENYATGRFDQKIRANDKLSASYFWDSGPQSQEAPLGNATHEVFSRRQMASIEETHVFSPAVVNTSARRHQPGARGHQHSCFRERRGHRSHARDCPWRKRHPADCCLAGVTHYRYRIGRPEPLSTPLDVRPVV